MTDPTEASLPAEILAYYEQGREAGRLMRVDGQLELSRTQELLQRYLPPPPAIIADVGGGPGIYACWLAQLGYHVHLIDPVPLHVEQAKDASTAQLDFPLSSATIGDARGLHLRDSSSDAVLLLGPLYHLTERADRLLALREAYRVLRDGGMLFAAGCTRFGSALDGLFGGFLADPDFVRIMEDDLQTGQHRNPSAKPGYFTTAFLHHPEELNAEVEESGFHKEATMTIEGVAWLLHNLEEQWQQPDNRARLLKVVRALENEPSLLGIGAHFMVVGRK